MSEFTKSYSDVVTHEAQNNYSKDREISGEELAIGQVVAARTADGKIVEFNPGGADGSENILGVVGTETTAVDQGVTVLKRHAIVVADELVWKDGITTNDKAAAVDALQTAGVLVR